VPPPSGGSTPYATFEIGSKRVDWEAQFRKALRAFQANRFLILVDRRQLDGLDDEIELRHDTEITFLKLVPLAGG
jgi:hypothetical protein